MKQDYFPLKGEKLKRRKIAWEGLGNRVPFGRPAIFFNGGLPDSKKIEKEIPPVTDICLSGRIERNESWDMNIRTQIHKLCIKANSDYQDDAFPAVDIPRNIYGQSQGLTELFGCKLIPHPGEKDLFHPVPFIKNASDVDKIKTYPVDGCLYSKAIEFAKYAFESTNGQLSVRNPVMTGPIDTANYMLGTMRLMEWIYDEPKALCKLLQMITEVLIKVIKKIQEAVSGRLCPEDTYCIDRGYGFASEVRSLISSDAHREFEAPYLRQIGEECGEYTIHSCGSWERAIPSLVEDNNVMMINFQSREMDLRKVCELTKGKISISVQKSMDLDERYIWEDDMSFYKYVAASVPNPVPIEIRIDDIPAYYEFLKSYKQESFNIFKHQQMVEY